MIVGKRDRASTTYNPYATIDIYSSPYIILQEQQQLNNTT